MILFDGKAFAALKEKALKERFGLLREKHPFPPHVLSIVFAEDQGGVIYAQEKATVAERIGIGYDVFTLSLATDTKELINTINELCQNPKYSGVIIQKPWRNTWVNVQHSKKLSFSAFQTWWQTLTNLIPVEKDIDGLHPSLMNLIETDQWKKNDRVLPATCRAVLSILEYAQNELELSLDESPSLMIGRSDLLGLPLYLTLNNQGWDIQLYGKKELDQQLSQPEQLTHFKTIISSTGIEKLIKADYVGPHCVLIDAGFPLGDIDAEALGLKPSFLTPVPYGVGPVTVISLLENTIDLWYNSFSR